jgi:hypothetical protein
MTRNYEFTLGVEKKLQLEGEDDLKLDIRRGSAISGTINCPQQTVIFDVSGGCAVNFSGKCFRVVVLNLQWGSVLDLRDLDCEEAVIDNVSGGSVLIIAAREKIQSVKIAGGSVLYLVHEPDIQNMSLSGGSAIEPFVNYTSGQSIGWKLAEKVLGFFKIR